MGAMTGAIVATGIVFFPAAPFFLFMHGKDITMPKGAEFTAYVNGDVKLDIAKFQHGAPGAESPTNGTASSASQSVSPTSAKVSLESNPADAEVEVDGSFVGNTPSDVQLTEGEHTITVKKAGFKDWERKLKVSAGNSVHLSADLEKIATP